ncbi:hypothetical protein [Xanthomonas sacchari]|uniref:hypothetical protein n=1 Tax=Xanthomonas sacchari TaxID=56458 RepID=UPI00224CF099|nr:hypothetical protein [Xanthomonas sacchari]MCW0371153.1 hypothetical protein [Xanthomonas sacchari]
MGVDLEANSVLLTELLEEATSCTPETWDRGALTIVSDGSHIQYKLKNEASSDKAQISERLRELCESYYVSMAQQGSVWISAVLEFWRENGKWKWRVAFTYDDTDAPQAPPATPSPKRPWWKVWN